MASTTTDENEELVRDYLRAWREGDPDALSALFAADFSTTITEPTGEEMTLDVEGLQAMMRQYHDTFADIDLEIHEVVAEGDRVMTRITYTGTHDEEYLGIEPTGNRVTVDEFLSFGMADGKIVEEHGLWDQLGLLRQLDVEVPIDSPER